jgi:Skp family chaperone for outer membrane proteins
MSDDSDLYGEDILLWSKKQSELLRRLAAGERVTDQVDWPNIVDEIADVGHGHVQPPSADPAITELRQQLARAEATIVELRERLDDAQAKLADAQAEPAAAQDQVEVASTRAVAAVEAEQGLRQADAERRARDRLCRILDAWRGE